MAGRVGLNHDTLDPAAPLRRLGLARSPLLGAAAG